MLFIVRISSTFQTCNITYITEQRIADRRAIIKNNWLSEPLVQQIQGEDFLEI